jgi:NAD(P)H-flavin reductase
MGVQEYLGVVTDIAEVTPSTRKIHVEVETPQGFAFRPGQWVSFIFLPDETNVPLLRAYSIASSPRRPEKLTFYIRRIPGGRGSELAWKLVPGEKVAFRGPYGDFTPLPPLSPNLLFLTSEMGFVPVRSILADLLQSKTKSKILLFWGMKSKDDLFCLENLEFWRKNFSNFHYKVCLTDPPADWPGYHGQVLEAAQTRLKHFEHLEVFLSGLSGMVDEATAFCLEKGLSKAKIHREPFY